MPACIIKNAIESLARPFVIMWNKSLLTGEIPADLKVGTITPSYKGGNKCEPKNYRPVTLTSHIIKLFERVLVKKIVDHLQGGNLIDNRQHGFRAGRSCLSQLLTHHQEIVEALCYGWDVDVVYLDYAKAFDKVDHRKLLQKLGAYKLGGLMTRWIKAFLENRSIKVYVNNVFSYPSKVLSGVPQGSVLGPLLFLMYTQDTTEKISYSSILYFADDTKLKNRTKSVDDCRRLQQDLDNIYDWANENKMVLNGEKFKLLRYSVTGEPSDFSYLDSEGSPITPCDNAVDLGVIVSSNAKFNENIINIVKKADNRMRWIFRVFRTREPTAMLTLFRALVLPILEYCSQLWHPAEAGMTQHIEAVQRSFTARINGLAHLNYWDRLKHLRLYSLERRRERYIVLYVYKILSNLCPNLEGSDAIVSYYNVRLGRMCRTPGLIRQARQKHRSIREQSFGIVGPVLFNSMPKRLRDYEGSLHGFKGLLDEFLYSLPDEPPMPGYFRPGSSNRIIEKLRTERAKR